MDEMLTTGATRLAAAIRGGTVTALEAMEAVIARIEAVNPRLNAVVTMDRERCLTLARAADEAARRGEQLGPLHGVPMTVKDNIAVAGMRTTAAHLPFRDNVPDRDSAVVARLRSAGAIVIGKTNLPEMAGDLQTDNALFGRTSNPWDLERTPGGSSGGEAAAVASGMSFLGLGNDLLVSVRLPAHYCGLFSYLPTSGLLPNSGLTPSGMAGGAMKHMLRMGFLARSPEDLQTAAEVAAGPVPEEPWMPPADPLRRPIEKEPLPAAIRCTVCMRAGDVPVSRETAEVLRSFAASLSSAGVPVTELHGDICDHDKAARVWAGIFSQAMGRMLPPVVRFLASLGSGALRPSLEQYHSLETARYGIIAEIDRLFEGTDVLLTPVSSTPAFRHMSPIRARGPSKTYGPIDVDGRAVSYAGATSAYGFRFALTGHPVATIPAGRSSEGLPIGIQAVGRRWDDRWFLAALAPLCRGRASFAPPPVEGAAR